MKLKKKSRNYAEFQALTKEEKDEIINPKNDFVFKKIFGEVGKEDILKDFLEGVLNQKIKHILLDKKTILEADMIDEKSGVLDVRATFEDGTNIDIEIQNSPNDDIQNRAVYYASRLYSNSIKVGAFYENLTKAIVIFITEFTLFKDIEKYHTSWKLREEDQKIKPMEQIEIHFIELEKFIKSNYDINQKLDQWLVFIENSKKGDIEEIMKENVNVKKAAEKVEELKSSEKEEYLAWLRQKYLLEMHSAKSYGRRKGFEEGMEKGREEGIAEEREKTIKLLRRLGYTDGQIAKEMEIDIEEVKKLKKRINIIFNKSKKIGLVKY